MGRRFEMCYRVIVPTTCQPARTINECGRQSSTKGNGDLIYIRIEPPAIVEVTEDPSIFAQNLFVWVRDARSWAERLLQDDPQICTAMFQQVEQGLENTREFFRPELGSNPTAVDDKHATEALVGWAGRRGFELSGGPVRIWGAILEIVDAALWLGWLFPRAKV